MNLKVRKMILQKHFEIICDARTVSLHIDIAMKSGSFHGIAPVEPRITVKLYDPLVNCLCHENQSDSTDSLQVSGLTVIFQLYFTLKKGENFINQLYVQLHVRTQ